MLSKTSISHPAGPGEAAVGLISVQQQQRNAGGFEAARSSACQRSRCSLHRTTPLSFLMADSRNRSSGVFPSKISS